MDHFFYACFLSLSSLAFGMTCMASVNWYELFGMNHLTWAVWQIRRLANEPFGKLSIWQFKWSIWQMIRLAKDQFGKWAVWQMSRLKNKSLGKWVIWHDEHTLQAKLLYTSTFKDLVNFPGWPWQFCSCLDGFPVHIFFPMESWIWSKYRSWFVWKLWYSQEWKCHGKPEKLHCRVNINFRPGLIQDLWPWESVQDSSPVSLSWTLSQGQKVLNLAGSEANVDPTKNHSC